VSLLLLTIDLQKRKVVDSKSLHPCSDSSARVILFWAVSMTVGMCLSWWYRREIFCDMVKC